MIRIEVTKTGTLSGHRDCIYTIESGKSSEILYSSGADGMVVQWDLNTPEEGVMVAKVSNSVYALHYLENDNKLLIGQNFEGVHLVDTLERKEITSAKITDSSIFDIKSSGEFIYVATGDGTLIVLLQDLTTAVKLKLSDSSLRTIAISPDKKWLAAGGSDHKIRIFTLPDLKLFKELPAHLNSVFTITFSPDGNYLLSGGRDARLKIWSVIENFELKQEIVAHLFALNHICYSPDGKHFATCSMDKSVKVWDANEFRLLKVIDKARHAGHGTSVNKLVWTTFSNYLLSAGDDRVISLWDLKFKETV